MPDSIFTQILKGDIPSHKIYEDDHTFAFLDIHPIQPGQVLVIPKEQIDHLWDLPPETYAAVMQTVHKVAQRLQAAFPAGRIGMQVEGLDVPHAHVKLFPFTTHQEYNNHPDPTSEPDHQALAALAQKLAF
jgi:histidine triad (HIT) family protein